MTFSYIPPCVSSSRYTYTCAVQLSLSCIVFMILKLYFVRVLLLFKERVTFSTISIGCFYRIAMKHYVKAFVSVCFTAMMFTIIIMIYDYMTL